MPKQFDVNSVIDTMDMDGYKPLPDEREFVNDADLDEDYEDDEELDYDKFEGWD